MSRAPTVASGLVTLFGHDPASYRPHPVHAGGAATYRETNCYTDVLIELLHARGDEPLAALGTTLRLDFEGDQWTFFKPAPGDLEVLFGVDVHEMQPYRPLPEQIEDQLAAGRTILVELDAWYLPDTASTSYRSEHVKTSIAVEAIDTREERLHYFHNTALHALGGEDYRGAFRLDGSDPEVLPPYTELVRFDAGPRLEGEELRVTARRLLQGHLEHRPSVNPFVRFGDRLEEDIERLLEADPREYHDYAFATVRMAGAGFELAAAHVQWVLGQHGASAYSALNRLVEGCKLLSLKLARRRHFDPRVTLDELREAWAEAQEALDHALI